MVTLVWPTLAWMDTSLKFPTQIFKFFKSKFSLSQITTNMKSNDPIIVGIWKGELG